MVSEKTENFINQFRQNRIFFFGGWGGGKLVVNSDDRSETLIVLDGAVHYKETLKSFAKSRA